MKWKKNSQGRREEAEENTYSQDGPLKGVEQGGEKN